MQIRRGGARSTGGAGEEKRTKRRERKSEPGCARWTAAERILTLVVVVDGSEQVGIPSLVEEAIFRAGSRRTWHGSLRSSLVWPTPAEQPIPTVLICIHSVQKEIG
jgi:hypothetical protein